jgi:hypothetical protein
LPSTLFQYAQDQDWAVLFQTWLFNQTASISGVGFSLSSRPGETASLKGQIVSWGTCPTKPLHKVATNPANSPTQGRNVPILKEHNAGQWHRLRENVGEQRMNCFLPFLFDCVWPVLLFSCST